MECDICRGRKLFEQILIIPTENEVQGGYIGITVCSSVCLSAVLCPALNFISVWCWLTIFGKWVYHNETMCHVHSWFWYDVDLWPQGLYSVNDMFSSPAHNYFLFWLWLTIFGTCIYHHERMYCVHSWSRYDVDLWPQGKIYRVFLVCSYLTWTSVCFDIGLPYLAHESNTMRECVVYVHDPDNILTFDLKVKFIGFMTWLCVRATAFLSFDIVILCLAL